MVDLKVEQAGGDDDIAKFARLMADVDIAAENLPHFTRPHSSHDISEDDMKILEDAEDFGSKNFDFSRIPLNRLEDLSLSSECLRRFIHGSFFRIPIVAVIRALQTIKKVDSRIDNDAPIYEYLMTKEWGGDDKYFPDVCRLIGEVLSNDTASDLREGITWLYGDKFRSVKNVIAFTNNVDFGLKSRVPFLSYLLNQNLVSKWEDYKALIDNMSDPHLSGVLQYVIAREREKFIFNRSLQRYTHQDTVHVKEQREHGELLISFRRDNLTTNLEEITTMIRDLSPSYHAEYIRLFIASSKLNVFKNTAEFNEFLDDIDNTSQDFKVETDAIRLRYIKEYANGAKLSNDDLISILESMNSSRNKVVGFFKYFIPNQRKPDDYMKMYLQTIR